MEKATDPGPFERPEFAWSSRAALDVVAERRRQIEAEGWDFSHDDEHTDGSLAAAAACYAIPDEARQYVRKADTKPDERTVGETRVAYSMVPNPWPRSWAGWWWKPKDRRSDLVRAAALLIAEIERLDRMTPNDESNRTPREAD